jgi:hypothetical protein
MKGGNFISSQVEGNIEHLKLSYVGMYICTRTRERLESWNFGTKFFKGKKIEAQLKPTK